MTTIRHRSPPPSASSHAAKKLKTSHSHVAEDPTSHFASRLLEDQNVDLLHAQYRQSQPFLHVVVDKLFQDDLLTKVKNECLAELSFTEKETDIFKVHQTGDLASLSYLTESQLASLHNLLTLRDALYSAAFRLFIRKVTGCGPLSGTKMDMSVNTYRKGCHLLNHDDVIGSRRVSYILYMPLPQSQQWQEAWGGALELYPVKPDSNGTIEPEPIPTKTIPPSWNQFIFFEVQPGKSFHSVEEVVVDEGDGERQRLSISGWFHVAQEGEEGYEREPSVKEAKSSLERLTSATTSFTPYPETESSPLPNASLSQAHLSFLSEYLNPVYLQEKTLQTLVTRFVEESSLELHSFLCEPLATKLETELRLKDAADGLGKSRRGRIPPHRTGIDDTWIVQGPPHKSRYCVLSTRGGSSDSMTLNAPGISSDEIIRNLQDKLFPSSAFRAWLAHVASLVPMQFAVEGRRFRPGLDYTLATSDEKEARLDVVLGLTPAAEEDKDGKAKAQDRDEISNWEGGRCGGWECYMAPHEGDEDPTVYRSGSSKRPADKRGASANEGSDQDESVVGDNIDHDVGSEDEEEDESIDDDTLLTVQPGFNRLLLVLRDEGVMHFVKYVSSSAEGSRWDICGEYEIGMLEEDSD